MSVFPNLLILTTALVLQGCLKRDAPQATSGSSLGSCYINQTSASPNSYLPLGQTGADLTTYKIAQGFKVRADTTFLPTAEIWIKKIQHPGGYLLLTIQRNSGGTPDGISPFTSSDQEIKNMNGLPDGSPLYGGTFRTFEIPESPNPQRITFQLDHGSLAKNFDPKSRTLASTQSSSSAPISLKAGMYWLVLEFKAPGNSSDYIQWGSYQNNPYKEGRALAYLENFAKRAWSIAPTGADRDMTFSLGCKND